ncbi:MAG: hypothetical protein U9O65_10655 [Thermotogota bacterium]|nr:hypothetical protein [Thermotogota bacterium]
MSIYDRDWYREQHKEQKPSPEKKAPAKQFLYGFILGVVVTAIFFFLVF